MRCVTLFIIDDLLLNFGDRFLMGQFLRAFHPVLSLLHTAETEGILLLASLIFKRRMTLPNILTKMPWMLRVKSRDRSQMISVR